MQLLGAFKMRGYPVLNHSYCKKIREKLEFLLEKSTAIIFDT